MHMFLHFMQNSFHSAVGGVLSLRRPAGAFGGIRTNTARGNSSENKANGKAQHLRAVHDEFMGKCLAFGPGGVNRRPWAV